MNNKQLSDFVNKLSEHVNVKFVACIVLIISYIISFSYLLHDQSAEYMAWIFTFIVNTFFPFVWLEDFMKLSKILSTKNKSGELENPAHYYSYLYAFACVGITFLLQFVVLVFIMIKNENIRKMKKREKERQNNSLELNEKKVDTTNIATSDKLVERRDKVTTKLYITSTVLIWGIVAYNFSEYISILKDKEKDADPNLSRSLTKGSFTIGADIEWWISLIHNGALSIDGIWHEYVDAIQAPPMVKSFSMYCITFIAIFFGCFIRIPRHPLSHNKNDRYRIVNIDTVFNAKFERRMKDYKELTMFFFASFISFCTLLFFFMISVPKNIALGLSFCCMVVYFAVFYKKIDKIFKTRENLQKIIYFFFCLIFAFLGTPPAIGLIEVGMRLANQSLNKKVWGVNLLSISVGFIFTFLLFFLYGYGIDKKWVFNDEGKPFKTFLAVMITMAISLFMALSTQFNMLTALYTGVVSLLKLVLKYLAPIGLISFIIVQFIFTFKNYQQFKRKTDG